MQALRQLKTQILEYEHSHNMRDIDGRRRFNARLRHLRAGGGAPIPWNAIESWDAVQEYLVDAEANKVLTLPLPYTLVADAAKAARLRKEEEERRRREAEEEEHRRREAEELLRKKEEKKRAEENKERLRKEAEERRRKEAENKERLRKEAENKERLRKEAEERLRKEEEKRLRKEEADTKERKRQDDAAKAARWKTRGKIILGSIMIMWAIYQLYNLWHAPSSGVPGVEATTRISGADANVMPAAEAMYNSILYTENTGNRTDLNSILQQYIPGRNATQFTHQQNAVRTFIQRLRGKEEALEEALFHNPNIFQQIKDLATQFLSPRSSCPLPQIGGISLQDGHHVYQVTYEKDGSIVEGVSLHQMPFSLGSERLKYSFSTPYEVYPDINREWKTYLEQQRAVVGTPGYLGGKALTADQVRSILQQFVKKFKVMTATTAERKTQALELLICKFRELAEAAVPNMVTDPSPNPYPTGTWAISGGGRGTYLQQHLISDLVSPRPYKIGVSSIQHVYSSIIQHLKLCGGTNANMVYTWPDTDMEPQLRQLWECIRAIMMCCLYLGACLQAGAFDDIVVGILLYYILG